MVKQLIRFIAAMAVASGALLTVSGTACACSCMPNPNMAERVEKADVVFTGTAVDTKTNGRTKVVTFDVGTTFKGPAKTRQEIVTADNSAACGLEIEDKGEYLVFGSKGDQGLELAMSPDQYTASLCGGADPVTKKGLDEVSAVKGVTPTQVINEKAPAQPAKANVPAAKPQATPEQAATSAPVWPWAAGAVLLLAAAGGLVWWRRARA